MWPFSRDRPGAGFWPGPGHPNLAGAGGRILAGAGDFLLEKGEKLSLNSKFIKTVNVSKRTCPDTTFFICFTYVWLKIIMMAKTKSLHYWKFRIFGEFEFEIWGKNPRPNLRFWPGRGRGANFGRGRGPGRSLGLSKCLRYDDVIIMVFTCIITWLWVGCIFFDAVKSIGWDEIRSNNHEKMVQFWKIHTPITTNTGTI